MKKKILIASLAISALLFSACSKEVKEEPEEKKEQEIIEDKKEEVVYSGLILTPEIIVEGHNVTGKVTLENTLNEPVVFTEREEDDLIYISVKKENGDLLFETKIKDRNRDEINPMEKVSWDVEGILLPNSEKRYLIEVSFLLKDTKTIKYTQKELERTFVYEKPQEDNAYLPEKTVTYVYNDGVRDLREKFLFFEGSLVQSQSEAEGKKVYHINEKGLYLLHANDFENQGTSILGNVDIEKGELLLKLPATVGDKWSSNGVEHEILSTTETIVTPYKEFTNAIKVKLGGETELYYHKEVGLVHVTYNGEMVQTLRAVQ